MKNTDLIFGVILLAITLSNNLAAGPVYAAKWERPLEDGSKQTVALYGDEHTTHEIDENREREAINAFCRELAKVDTETLVLCEDFKSAPFSTIFSDQDCQIWFGEWNQSFISAACNFAYEISRSADFQIHVQSIDPRTELFELTDMAIRYTRDVYGYCKPINLDHKPFYKKAYDTMKDEKVVDIFERVITNVKSLKKSADDDQSGKIFDEIIATLQKRKVFWLEEIMKKYFLSKDEINQITIDNIGKIEAKTSQGFLYLRDIDKFMRYEVKLHYCLEVVDANALWHITKEQKQYKKIVIIAGAAHVRNLEKYLLRIGFEQCCVAGQDYNLAAEALEDARGHFYNVYNANHKLRASSLDPFDKFGLSLFDDEIDAAWQKVDTLPDSSLSEELKQACRDYEVAIKEYKSFGSAYLVPFETFKWIHDEDQNEEINNEDQDQGKLTTKRDRDDDTHVLPDAKKPRLDDSEKTLMNKQVPRNIKLKKLKATKNNG